MSVERLAVQPTREQLLRLRRRKVLAQAVLDVLQRDLSALTEEFFRYLDMITPLRNEMYKALEEAYAAFSEAKMLMGRGIFSSSWTTLFDRFEVDTKATVFRKVSIPVLNLVEAGVVAQDKPMGTESLNYSLLDTTAKLDEMTRKVREVLRNAIKLAEAEGALSTIVEAMAATKRKMNFIQHKAIPQIDATIRWVELILEETEREDSIRIRVLQNKRKEKRLS